MPIKMKFPDGTEVEGEVEEITELITQLKDLLGPGAVPDLEKSMK